MKVTDRKFLGLASLIILAWFAVYFDALVAMESIWSRSDTFAHGYFILPISLWLIWRDRHVLLSASVNSTWLPVPLLVISLFVGLFSYAADIDVLRQLSAVTSLILVIWALIGNKLVWHYKFPLAYLLFTVPMGENLIPWLQDVTAWFTVFFLKLNGIPVFVDGLYIQIPTGMFEVAVACSGIRYLIASIAVGSLYGYLTFNKIHKQLIFFIFALLLPILANGIRAYGIVAIAYYSDMEYATGADHLIYGWVFFGFIIMLMFWIGGFFADESSSHTVSVGLAKQPQPTLDASLSTISVILAPILCVSFLISQAIPVVDPTSKPGNAYDNQATENTSWGINFIHALNYAEVLTFGEMEVFSAIYANKQSKGEMISWDNVTHNHDAWTIVGSKNLEVEGKSIGLVHLRNINGVPRSYLYQYKVGSFYTVNKNKAKLMQAWNSLTRQSDYSEVRAISVLNQQDFTIAEQQLIKRFIEIDFSQLSAKYAHHEAVEVE